MEGPAKWEDCTDKVDYNQGDQLLYMEPLYNFLLCVRCVCICVYIWAFPLGRWTNHYYTTPPPPQRGDGRGDARAHHLGGRRLGVRDAWHGTLADPDGVRIGWGCGMGRGCGGSVGADFAFVVGVRSPTHIQSNPIQSGPTTGGRS